MAIEQGVGVLLLFEKVDRIGQVTAEKRSPGIRFKTRVSRGIPDIIEMEPINRIFPDDLRDHLNEELSHFRQRGGEEKILITVSRKTVTAGVAGQRAVTTFYHPIGVSPDDVHRVFGHPWGRPHVEEVYPDVNFQTIFMGLIEEIAEGIKIYIIIQKLADGKDRRRVERIPTANGLHKKDTEPSLDSILDGPVNGRFGSKRSSDDPERSPLILE